MFLVENLLKSDLLSDYTFYIIPLVNPDGYNHSFEMKRLWRKNMNGVDINRNFPKGYGIHSSSNPEDQDYRGKEPFSENESKALRTLITSNKFYIHLDIHSYGQLIAGSWAYTNEKHKKSKEFERLGKKMVSAMNTSYVYGHGSMNGKLGLSGGTLQDYTTSQGIYGFTIELPTKDSFNPHPSNIIPAGKDIMRAIKSICPKMKIKIIEKNDCYCYEILILILLLVLIFLNFKTTRNLF